ncbi:MAG: hypothetical protein FWC50_03150 [Planctomycetaceae bacterium]|nr:hypothetical protein [Planctomycetaceae bacterium]
MTTESPPSFAEIPFTHGYCRVNISWGGGKPETWSGEMKLPDGQMSQATSLGTEVDVPGTIWSDAGMIKFRSKSPKTFSGVHVTLNANPDSVLQIHFCSRDQKIDVVKTFAVAELAKGALEQMLDETGNRVRIERVPGDELSVNLLQKTTLFSPGEILQFEVLPRFLSTVWEKNPTLTVSLFRGRSNDRVNEIETVVSGNDASPARQPIPISLSLPNEEGVYDVVLTLHLKAERSLLRSGKERVLAQRTFQCLVLSKQLPPSLQNTGNITTRNGVPDYRGTLIESVDPSNPNWWKKFAKSSPLPLIGNLAGGQQQQGQQPSQHQYEPFPKPEEEKSTLENVRERFVHLSPGQLWQRNNPNNKGIWQGNLGSGHLVPHQSKRYNATGFVELQPTHDKNVTAWEAYSIPVQEPGKPHFLEIEYLSGVPQTLGISVIEPSVSGGIFPATIDSGLHVSDEIVSDDVPGRTLQHRILFWPKTREPMILLTNQDSEKPAVFGGIRIYRAADQFPQQPQTAGGNPVKTNDQQRLFAAYLHRPFFCENFSATRVPGNVPNVGVTDWGTFYQGTTRLAQYMRMAGYGGLMISVASDGSCLYPSRCLAPTPRYDSGVFFSNGEEPVRKDVLEALATTFDRENLTLIPAIDFCMPLPELEEKIRQNESTNNTTTNNTATSGETGIVWIGPQGHSLVDQQTGAGNVTGRAPYYNLLNSEVQNAMIEVVREMVERSAKHPSFGGIAIQLSPEGYAMLPDENWGLDDGTILRFTRDTQIDVPGAGADRFRARAEFLRTQCLEQWLRWRAAQVAAFYKRMRNVVTEVRPDAKLYLAGAKMFDGPLCRKMFLPSLTRPGSVYQAMIYQGFDPVLYQNEPALVLMRPEKVVATDNLAETAVDIELAHNDMTQVFQQWSQRLNRPAASLFYHQPIEQTIASFDAASPYQPSNAWFSTEAVPADCQNRKRFVKHLADMDMSLIFDGGCMLPLGEEEATREMMQQFQMLPNVLFHTYANEENDMSLQPVTLRFANTERGTYCYLLNNAPFSVPVKVTFSARQGCRIGVLSPSRIMGAPQTVANGFEYSETLHSYDFVAFVISDGNARPVKVDVNRPSNILGANGQINQRVADLTDRINYSSAWIAWDKLINGQFEMTAADWQKYLISHAPPGTPTGTSADIAATGQDTNAGSTGGSRPRLFPAVSVPPITSIFPGRNSVSGKGGPDKSDNTAKSINEMSIANNSSGTTTSVLSAGNVQEAKTSGIPGWQVDGDATFEAETDFQVHKNGTAGLRMTAGQTPGRVVSHDFPAPKTGRLFVSAWVGIPENATDLPLRITLGGQHRNMPMPVRQATLAPMIWPIISQAAPINGVRWHQVVVPFSDLPLDADTLAVGFELFAPGTVWIDDVNLYQLAFTDAERTALIRIGAVVNHRLGKERISETLSMLDGYWARLLAQSIPDVDELRKQRNASISAQQQGVSSVSAPAAPATANQVKTSDEKETGVWGRFKKLKWW